MMMKSRHRQVLATALVALMATAAGPASAMSCIQREEAAAFTLRHLQTQLMVAALSCNQKDAYTTFVQHFQQELAEGGRKLNSYFERVGGGKPALNAYVTEIANAAGLNRASDPHGFCEKTWALFLNLEQAPERLLAYAEESLMRVASVPQDCAVQTPGVPGTTVAMAKVPVQTAVAAPRAVPSAVAVMETAAPREAEAAAIIPGGQ